MNDPTSLTQEAFEALLNQLMQQRSRVQLYYFGELHDLCSATSLIRARLMQANTDWIELVSGEQIQVKQVVSANGVLAPNYADFAMCLTCRCDC